MGIRRISDEDDEVLSDFHYSRIKELSSLDVLNREQSNLAMQLRLSEESPNFKKPLFKE